MGMWTNYECGRLQSDRRSVQAVRRGVRASLPVGNHCCRDLSVLAMCGFILSFYGRLRTNTHPGQIHRRRSIPDSIPLVPAVPDIAGPVEFIHLACFRP